jgi:hypothetical protein
MPYRVMQYESAAKIEIPVATPRMAQIFIPVSLTLPFIIGIGQVGQTLTASPGAWLNNPTFTYQWFRDTTATSITSVTASNAYVPVTADIGHMLLVGVTGTNGFGSWTTYSALTASIIGALPVNTVLPSITGGAVVGNTLVGHAGTWLNGPVTLTYQWARGGTPVAGQTTVSGYLVTAADVGFFITLIETATSTTGGGSASATSLQTTIVPGTDFLTLGLHLTANSVPTAAL